MSVSSCPVSLPQASFFLENSARIFGPWFHICWARITGQELTDMLVYLQNLPETRNLAKNFSFPPSDSGEKLFSSKGCTECHVGKRALEVLLKNQTLTEIAVDMWNHQPSMKNPPPTFQPDEIQQIIAYIWTKQYFRGTGNVN